jgi:hypothetical protein
MTQKRIALEPRLEATGLVIAVTFPFPLTGKLVTRDVAISDDAARRLIARVQEFLALRERGTRQLPR